MKILDKRVIEFCCALLCDPSAFGNTVVKRAFIDGVDAQHANIKAKEEIRFQICKRIIIFRSVSRLEFFDPLKVKRTIRKLKIKKINKIGQSTWVCS